MKRVFITGPLAALLIILALIIGLVFILPIAIIAIAVIFLLAAMTFLARGFRKKKGKKPEFIDVEYAVKKE
jgi:membrane protein implicated in regulation of membrane protease activity